MTRGFIPSGPAADKDLKEAILFLMLSFVIKDTLSEFQENLDLIEAGLRSEGFIAVVGSEQVDLTQPGKWVDMRLSTASIGDLFLVANSSMFCFLSD